VRAKREPYGNRGAPPDRQYFLIFAFIVTSLLV